MNSKVYWVWLQQALGIGCVTDEIVSFFRTAENIYFASNEERQKSGVFSKIQLRKLRETPITVTENIIQSCRECKCRIMTPDDERYPKKLFEINNFPLVLYYKGNIEVLKNKMAVSIVGTRRATQTGLKVSYGLASSLTKSGTVIVSGGALGIDGAAHMGALSRGGETVAVLGCGFKATYHDSTEVLKDGILENGLILTEYPPDEPPLGRHFPVRNRLISGLSYGVVVVEGSSRSGTLITGRLAKEQGRELFAVPGDASKPESAASMEVIQKYNAKPVFSASDVLSAFEFVYPGMTDYENADRTHFYEQKINVDFSKIAYGQKKTVKKEKPDEVETLNEEQPIPELKGYAKDVYEVLNDEPMHIDDIMRKLTSLSMGNIMVGLTQLEMENIIISDSGKKYRRK